ncbi:MAG TPA: hypothetical protein PL038_07415, partial [Bacteroidales bacterium]|nr:hypothetical protein [Bacteroidales bacterium]
VIIVNDIGSPPGVMYAAMINIIRKIIFLCFFNVLIETILNFIRKYIIIGNSKTNPNKTNNVVKVVKYESKVN